MIQYLYNKLCQLKDKTYFSQSLKSDGGGNLQAGAESLSDPLSFFSSSLPLLREWPPMALILDINRNKCKFDLCVIKILLQKLSCFSYKYRFNAGFSPYPTMIKKMYNLLFDPPIDFFDSADANESTCHESYIQNKVKFQSILSLFRCPSSQVYFRQRYTQTPDRHTDR